MTPPLTSILWPSLRAIQVFGANTGVGKTIFTTLLSRTAKRLWDDEAVSVLKPVSTGPADEADERCKFGFHEHHVGKFAPNVAFKTLFQYDLALSPHLSAQASSRPIPSDETLLMQCRDYASASRSNGQGKSWLFLETAGGVHSPAPSGTTQAELYAPLRLPVILVGDSRLGGISSTISAFESLRIRGYDVQSVLVFREEEFQNFAFLDQYFRKNHPDVLVFGTAEPPPPPSPHLAEANPSSSAEEDTKAMNQYYEEQSRQSGTAATILSYLNRQHESRIARLTSMAEKAHRSIWYPFTQQKLVSPEDITVIDSASGDYFQTLNPSSSSSSSKNDSLLRASFDGSASWWTQGLGHANSKLTLAAAYAAGRYGHVMFASAIHEPALSLAETLLQGMRNPRLSRVFYSDNGSTGCEVALKMGLGASKLRYGWNKEERLGVVGLKGSYHGDTIGAMDSAEPSCFNEKIDWYDGRGFWFDYPTVLCVNGAWQVQIPDALREQVDNGDAFDSLGQIFNLEEREQRGEHLRYEAYITKALEELHAQGQRFGALILEPVVLGAGGMALVDPLFQRTLVNTVRRSPHLFSKANVYPTPPDEDDEKGWTGLPVIFDEVFTGLYRLGRFTSSSFLDVEADISVHAKLLTGGLVPLCTTLSSESIFSAFISEDKSDALLHGHSYTAHPVGCQVALLSVRDMQGMELRGDWDWAKPQSSNDDDTSLAWSMWPDSLVVGLSRQTSRVSGTWALGSVLAIHLRDGDSAGGGYRSNAALGVRDALMRGGVDAAGTMWNVHCRVLGNVLYLMAGQKTTQESILRVSSLIEQSLR